MNLQRLVSILAFVLLTVLLGPALVVAEQSTADSQLGTEVCGTITHATWTIQGSPYTVSCNVLSTGSLSIDPGVTIKFMTGTQLDVDGVLSANGTSNAAILFTSANAVKTAGDWNGVHLHSGSNGSIIEYATIEYGTGVAADNTSVTVDHSTIRNNAASGFYLYNSQSIIRNTVVTENSAESGAGISVIYGTALLDTNEITWNQANTRGGGVHAYGWSAGATVTVTHNVISHNTLGSYGGAGILFDSADGVISDNEISYNLLREDGSSGGGVNISGASGPKVLLQGNRIRYNSAFEAAGVLTDAFTEIKDNLIAHNSAKQYGGLFYLYPSGRHGPSNALVSCNTITGNRGDPQRGNGVYSTVESPFHYNTIAANDGYQFAIGSASDLDATNNYWGTSDVNAIAAAIYDGTDMAGLGTVNAGSFLISPSSCAPVTTCIADTWEAAYFNNRDLSGIPSATKCQENIDFYWGNGKPDDSVGIDNFSVRWTQQIEFAQNGYYRFRTFTDDGLRLYVDGQKIIDDWNARSFAERSATQYLIQGTHLIVMEYVEWNNDAMAHLGWYKCSEGQSDCDLNIAPMYQTNYLANAMPTSCIDTPNQTIAAYGCLITSIAMALSTQGIATNPSELNGWLSSHDGYTGDTCTGDLNWSAIPRFALYKTNNQIQLKWEYTSNAADIIRNERQPVIMRVANGHWVLGVDVAEVNGSTTIGINDPHHAFSCSVVSGTPALPPLSALSCKAGSLRHAISEIDEVNYRGEVAPVSYLRKLSAERTPTIQFASHGTEMLLTNEQGQRVGYDATTGTILLEVPNSFYFDNEILASDESPGGKINRTLYIADNAESNYTLTLVSVPATAAVESNTIEIYAIGYDESFVATSAVITETISTEIGLSYDVQFQPGQSLELEKQVGDYNSKVFLPLTMK